MATSEDYEDLPPTTTWYMRAEVHSIGQTGNKFCYATYRTMRNGEKQPKIYVMSDRGSSDALASSTVQPTHFIVNMEVYHMCLHILQRPKNCPVGTNEETTDEVVVFAVLSVEKICSFSVPQKLKRKDTVTLAVGWNRVFVLDTKNSRILGYDVKAQRKSITKLRGPLVYDSDMHLRSSGTDELVFVEKNLVIYAVKVTGCEIIWKLNISACGHFKCYHGVGFHLEGETRMVGIVTLSTGDFEFRICLNLNEHLFYQCHCHFQVKSPRKSIWIRL